MEGGWREEEGWMREEEADIEHPLERDSSARQLASSFGAQSVASGVWAGRLANA